MVSYSFVYVSLPAKNLIPSVTHSATLYLGLFTYFFGVSKISSVRTNDTITCTILLHRQHFKVISINQNIGYEDRFHRLLELSHLKSREVIKVVQMTVIKQTRKCGRLS